MNGRSGEGPRVAGKQGIWAAGQVRKTLDKNGVVVVEGENPGFGGAAYYVYLGLRVGESGPIQYSPLDDLLGKDGRFYANVEQSTGFFDIHLEVQQLANQEVTIVWWACSTGIAAGRPTLEPTPPPPPPSRSPTCRPTGGPTPPPPTIPPIGLMVIGFKPENFPDRSVGELQGIDPEYVRLLTAAQMENLAVLASADAKHVAEVLDSSEVKAMGLIFEARHLLLGNRMP